MILMSWSNVWTYQVVPQELHDEGGVLVALLAQGVELCKVVVSTIQSQSVASKLTSNGIVKGKLGEMAGLVGRVQDFVVEDREVQGQAEADGVGGGKLGLGDLGSSLVGLERGIGSTLAAVTDGELSQVTVVVTLHLVVEDLGLAALGGLDEVLVQNLEDVVTDLGQLGLNLLAVLLDQSDLRLVAFGLLLLLDRGDNSPRSTAGTDDVLVGNRQQIPLLNGELHISRGNDLHVLDHLCIALSIAGTRTMELMGANLHSARPAQRAWRGKQRLRDPLCRSSKFVNCGQSILLYPKICVVMNVKMRDAITPSTSSPATGRGRQSHHPAWD